MKSVLILDGQSRAAVESTQSLGRAGVTVTVAAEDRRALSFHSRYARTKISQPPAIPAGVFLEWLRELDERNQFDLIVAPTETSLSALQQLPEDDPLRRRAILASNASLEIALDKNKTLELAEDLGVPVPATRVLTEDCWIPTPASFPVVLKPIRSKIADDGDLKTYEPVIVANAHQHEAVLDQWLPRMTVLQQEYVQGWGIGIEMLYENGNLVWFLAHERLHEWPLTGGASTYRRAIEPPVEMLGAARCLLDALRWHGVAMVEFKLRADGSFALMEINPRLWGSLALSIDAGVDFPLGLWKIATGQPLGRQPAYRRGLRTRHLSRDLHWMKANAVADRTNKLLLLRPKWKAVFELGLMLTNGERYDHFQWSDPGPFLEDVRRMVSASIEERRMRRRAAWMRKNRRKLLKNAIARTAEQTEFRRPTLLFVCQGNICRSPFAALVARKCLPAFDVESAGFERKAGRCTPANVFAEAGRMGFDMSDCRSTPITAEHVQRADLILSMDMLNYANLAKHFPASLDKVVPLGLFAVEPALEIQDPYNRDAAVTERVLRCILTAVAQMAITLDATANRTEQPTAESFSLSAIDQ